MSLRPLPSQVHTYQGINLFIYSDRKMKSRTSGIMVLACRAAPCIILPPGNIMTVHSMISTSNGYDIPGHSGIASYDRGTVPCFGQNIPD